MPCGGRDEATRPRDRRLRAIRASEAGASEYSLPRIDWPSRSGCRMSAPSRRHPAEAAPQSADHSSARAKISAAQSMNARTLGESCRFCGYRMDSGVPGGGCCGSTSTSVPFSRSRIGRSASPIACARPWPRGGRSRRNGTGASAFPDLCRSCRRWRGRFIPGDRPRARAVPAAHRFRGAVATRSSLNGFRIEQGQLCREYSDLLSQ